MQQKIASFSFRPSPPQNYQFQFLDTPQNIVATFRIASFSFQIHPKYYCQFQFQTPQILLKVIEQCLKTLRLIIFNYVGAVNGPTSITRHEVLKMQQRIASFSFQTPPNCQFQFQTPPKLPVSAFRPPKYCCQFQNCQFQFLDPPPPKLPVSVFRPPQNIVASFSFQTPPNIVKGNGVVFENFTINNI